MSLGSGYEPLLSAATTMDGLAEQIRQIAARALRQGETEWQSVAASLFRDRLHEVAGQVSASAAQVEAAGSALRLHAERATHEAMTFLSGP